MRPCGVPESQTPAACARRGKVWLEEYAREQIQLEEQHIAEVEKMMRKPGELNPAG